MHVYELQQYLEGMGFVGPKKPAPAPSTTQPVRRGGGLGWDRVPPRQPASMKRIVQPAIYRDPRAMPPIATTGGSPLVPYVPPGLTREQLYAMRDEARAREQEIENGQSSANGDGPDYDSEQRAVNENAINQAVNDSAGGTGIPATDAAPPVEQRNPLGLLAAIAAAYYFFGV